MLWIQTTSRRGSTSPLRTAIRSCRTSTPPTTWQDRPEGHGRFQRGPRQEPNDLDALRQIASIQRNIKHFDEAKATEQKIISLAPNDAEANYTIGVIDWTQAYKNAVQILGEQNLQDDGNGNVKMNKATCAKIKAANQPLVDEAMKYLQRAVEINPNYDDAMQYLNLSYRRKADLECPNDAARKDDLAQADQWVQKAIGARKANEAAKEKKAGGGVVMEEGK